MKKACAVFCIFVGASMVGMWCFLLAVKAVPEVNTEPVRIALHLAAEFLTAIALTAAGIGLLANKRWAGYAFWSSMGALLYSVCNAAGYFAQNGEAGMAVIFGALFVAAVIFMVMRGKACSGKNEA